MISFLIGKDWTALRDPSSHWGSIPTTLAGESLTDKYERGKHYIVNTKFKLFINQRVL